VVEPEAKAGGPGWRHLTFDEIDSTNLEALRRAGCGERGPLWITAGVQTLGRGRSGRKWMSPGGTLSATLLFSPACEMSALPQLSLVSGIATFDAICETLPDVERGSARLKWPNDVLIDGAKASGILVESTVFESGLAVVIGIGINVAAIPAVEDRTVTSLARHGALASAPEVGGILARALGRWLDVWDEGRRFDLVRLAWLERAGPLGAPMTVHVDGEKAGGRFLGLDAAGGLLLETSEGNTRTFTFGDVALGAPRV
jgi:BirA family biotin operon repressor/biotin-[acetyl-CoA-carboxylase] ligase